MDMPQNDHDLLIRVETKVEMLYKEVRELGQTMKTIEQSKLDKEQATHLKHDADTIHRDHETRLRRVERWGFGAIGAIGVIEFIIVVMK